MYNRGEQKQYVCEILGMINPDGTFFLDNTTVPTETRMNKYIDEATREIISLYGFRFTEAQCSIPFYHTIPTQGLYLSGTNTSGTAISGTISPYPDNILNIGCSVPFDYVSANNYSGMAFSGVSSAGVVSTGIAVSGSLVSTTYSGLGYSYDLGPGVEKIMAVTIPHIAQKLQVMTQYDMDQYAPLGNNSVTGTSTWYIEINGMSPSGNKSIQVYPFPPTDFRDKRMTLHYMKEHINMTSDSDTQNVIPQQFETIIIDKVLEKCYAQLSEPQNVAIYAKKVMDRGLQMRGWAERNYDSQRRWTDGDVRGGFMPNTSINIGTAGLLGLI